MPILDTIRNWFYGTPNLCGVAEAFTAGDELSRWGITHLKWFVDSRPVGVGITTATYDNEVSKAFGRWTTACPSLTFEQTNDRALGNIVVRTGRGQEMGFPPRMGIVANASMPTSDRFVGQVFLTLNADIVWVLKQAGLGGTTLLPVLLHEIGHNLGLFHSKLNNQAMTMGAYYETPQSEDIARIRELYPVTPAPVPTPTPTPTPVPASIRARIEVNQRFYEGNLPLTN